MPSSLNIRRVPNRINHEGHNRNKIESPAHNDVVRNFRRLGAHDRHLERLRHHHVQARVAEPADEHRFHVALPHAIAEDVDAVAAALDERRDVAVLWNRVEDAALHSVRVDDVALEDGICLLDAALDVPRRGEEVGVVRIDEILEDGARREQKGADEAGHANGNFRFDELAHLDCVFVFEKLLDF